jgi:hypothetical protein
MFQDADLEQISKTIMKNAQGFLATAHLISFVA